MNDIKPQAEIAGVKFYPVPAATDIECVLGFPTNQFFARNHRPAVPREFERMADDLFFNGGRLPEFAPEIDRGAAVRALKAWLCSWNPPHESKCSTVAYALWFWCDFDAVRAAASK